MSRGLGNGISMSKGATPPLAPSCLTARGVSPDAVCLHSSGHFFYKKLHFDTATFQTWSRIYPTLFLHGGTCYYDLKERVGSIFFIRSSTLTLLRYRRDLPRGI